MSKSNEERRINFDDPDGSDLGTGKYSSRITAEEWIELAEIKGVRFRAWKYEVVDADTVDGALVEIQPGCRTPVQYVETDHVFEENIQYGKFLLIHLDSEGLSVYKYDSSIEDVSFALQVVRGEIMCLYVLKDSIRPGEVIECEQPGFSTAKLQTVEKGTEKIGNLNIPSEFWQLIAALDEGREDELPIEVLDLAGEI